MGFIIPYNFVRRGRSAPMAPARPGDRFAGRAGHLTCRITALTPLFTPVWTPRVPGISPDLRFFQSNDRPALPGTALKGVFRSLAEAICGGCNPFEKDHQRACQSRKSLCPVCRVFGFLRGKLVHPGQLNINDARVLGERGTDWKLCDSIILKEQGTPKTRHTPFYKLNEEPRGRKFYYHHPKKRSDKDLPTNHQVNGRNSRIQPLFPASFEVAVRYGNLTDAELGLLLHVLDLPEDLCLKFGMGKALGLGSIRVQLAGFRETCQAGSDPAARYRALAAGGPAAEPAFETDAGHVQEWCAPLKSAFTREYAPLSPEGTDLWDLDLPNIQDLRLMLKWQHGLAGPIQHPTYGWFQEDKTVHPATSLPTAAEVANGAMMPDSPQRGR
ncbi:MAG: RAMP superfamily CRISPR-associated protein [Actinomycetota bacterium]